MNYSQATGNSKCNIFSQAFGVNYVSFADEQNSQKAQKTIGPESVAPNEKFNGITNNRELFNTTPEQMAVIAKANANAGMKPQTPTNANDNNLFNESLLDDFNISKVEVVRESERKIARKRSTANNQNVTFNEDVSIILPY